MMPASVLLCPTISTFSPRCRITNAAALSASPFRPALTISGVTPIADAIDSFDADLSLDPVAFTVDTPTEFAQDIIQVDEIESAADDVWGDLG